MTIALWIRRTDTDLTDEEIDRALATVRADPLVEGHAELRQVIEELLLVRGVGEVALRGPQGAALFGCGETAVLVAVAALEVLRDLGYK